jgi:hypothetical protein
VPQPFPIEGWILRTRRRCARAIMRRGSTTALTMARAFSILVESTWTILHLSPSGRGRREAPGEGFDQSIGCNPSPQPSPNGRGSTRRFVAGVSTKIEKALDAPDHGGMARRPHGRVRLDRPWFLLPRR